MKDPRLFYYSTLVTRIIDGDTFYGLVDLGFDIKIEKVFRLARIDCPELRSVDPEKIELARKALGYVSNRILGKSVTIKSTKYDKYGRSVAEVYVGEENISDALVKEGLARLYP